MLVLTPRMLSEVPGAVVDLRVGALCAGEERACCDSGGLSESFHDALVATSNVASASSVGQVGCALEVDDLGDGCG